MQVVGAHREVHEGLEVGLVRGLGELFGSAPVLGVAAAVRLARAPRLLGVGYGVALRSAMSAGQRGGNGVGEGGVEETGARPRRHRLENR